MKKKYLFSMATALLLAVTGCSDDLEKGANGGQPITGDAVYMAVNIMTPASSGVGSRAGNEDEDPTGGENGDGSITALTDENYVRSATIVLYSVAGATTKEELQDEDINSTGATVVTSVYTESVLNQNGGNQDYANHDYKATVRINSEDLEANVPYRILTIVNADVADQFKKGTALSDAKLEEINHYLVGDEKLLGRFVMSTHVEKNTPADGSKEEHSIIQFDGTETTEAKAKVATVWVERLAARIDYIGKDFDFKVKSKNEETGVEAEIATARLLGVAPINVAKYENSHTAYIFKQVTPSTDINAGLITLGNELPVQSPVVSPAHQAGLNYVIEPTTSNTDNKDFLNRFEAGFIDKINAQTGQMGFTDFSESKWQKDDHNSTATVKDRIICYAGENTMGVDNQIHGLSTGVIFKVKYNPTSLFVYNKENGQVESDKSDHTSSVFYRVNNKLYKDLAAAEAEFIATGTDNEDSDPLVKLRKNFTKTDWSGVEFDVTNLKNSLSSSPNKTKDLGYIAWLGEQLKDATDVNANTMNWDAFLATRDDIPATAEKGSQKIEKENTATIEYYGTDHICYYQYWIRHANNGKPNEMGIMEFAIVRNNVYQLDVTDISGLGMADPFDSTSKPNEGDESGLYLKVELYVKDWVQRLNDNIILQ